jgi:hypothetical protein
MPRARTGMEVTVGLHRPSPAASSHRPVRCPPGLPKPPPSRRLRSAQAGWRRTARQRAPRRVRCGRKRSDEPIAFTASREPRYPSVAASAGYPSDHPP